MRSNEHKFQIINLLQETRTIRVILKKLFSLFLLLALAAGAGFVYWATQPISGSAHEFTIKPGSSLRSSSQQIANAGVPIQPILFEVLARLNKQINSQDSTFKAGAFEAEAGITPLALLSKIVRGEFSQFSFALIEGWTFKQMRLAISQNPFLQHDTVEFSDAEILAKLNSEYDQPEGLFFPDTYLFPKGVSDMDVYKRAYSQLQQHLYTAWQQRDVAATPLKTPYEALILASIVEKETGMKSDRNMIAGVFVNRLRKGMLLQTDPTVIYGMGDQYQGKIRKRDLLQDTPYNTYTRTGLPPTPIALVGMESLMAALNPAHTDALYFVARGDGSSQFSSNLDDHNRAVNQFVR
ncbi:hypothetical protein S2091_3583 [Solimicrobium silvestre]|uniref:Endolytic murein transglycosylase n=1 Tax=Solimicrobium silvestre TaxID=2099400 RepID=A0A2S9GV90_9BURK|nr:hypothetical protein S2091_3583 [Solimicrobium silvestre]